MRIFINQLITLANYLVSIFAIIATAIFWANNAGNSLFASIFSLFVLCFMVFGLWAGHDERKKCLAILNEHGVKFLTPTWFSNVRALSNTCVHALSVTLFTITLFFIVESPPTHSNHITSNTYIFNWWSMLLSLFFLIALPLILNLIGCLLFKSSIAADKIDIMRLNGIDENS